MEVDSNYPTYLPHFMLIPLWNMVRDEVYIWSYNMVRDEVYIWSNMVRDEVCIIWSNMVRDEVYIWSNLVRDEVYIWSNMVRDEVYIWSNLVRDEVYIWSNMVRDEVYIWSIYTYQNGLTTIHRNTVHTTCGMTRNMFCWWRPLIGSLIYEDIARLWSSDVWMAWVLYRRKSTWVETPLAYIPRRLQQQRHHRPSSKCQLLVTCWWHWTPIWSNLLSNKSYWQK